jgi:hypothetical protein
MLKYLKKLLNRLQIYVFITYDAIPEIGEFKAPHKRGVKIH